MTKTSDAAALRIVDGSDAKRTMGTRFNRRDVLGLGVLAASAMGTSCAPSHAAAAPTQSSVGGPGARGPTRPCIVFDVNESLLDLTTLEPTFERIFHDRGAMRLWFANLILYSAALTVAERYIPFTDIGSAVMGMLASTKGIRIDDSDRSELVERFSTMPAHPEVPGALRKLRAAGFRLITLTDNLLEVQTRQLQTAGIVELFDRRFSADEVKHHKPSPQAYAHVEREVGLDASAFCLVACHTWDTIGALAAGWEAALIKRPGNDVLAVGPQPQVVGDNLDEVAEKLIARYFG
jgi:2-haloacid dehalogenase